MLVYSDFFNLGASPVCLHGGLNGEVGSTHSNEHSSLWTVV